MKSKLPFAVTMPGLILLTALTVPARAAESGKPLLRVQADSGELVGWRSFHQEPDTPTGAVWQLADRVLACKGLPLGYIRTEKEYANFVLRLEWRWPPGKAPGKGGVLIRTTGPDKIWPKSLEAQINAGDAGDFWGLDGYALSGQAERSKSLEHPQFGRLTNLAKTEPVEKKAGEWNTYEITADGPTVTLKINGKVVNRATGCKPGSGTICLTSEGNEIHFRNVRLTPIVRSAD
ncbi:MAG TPA: DUF1080 domain-containing protein [Thermoguttaceae bacterium]|nr:DUF1080 domain-containing protein [Thermoguttaceae bacterium]